MTNKHDKIFRTILDKKETCLEIAKNLLKLKMPISQISEVTKLSKDEIEKLINI